MSDKSLKIVAKAAGGRPARISREQIFSEARKLGAGELTFKRIAERLGVRESALYHRFNSREELLNELALELAKEFSLAPAHPKHWRPWLEETALRFYDFLLANPVILEINNWQGLAQFGMPVMEMVMEALKAAGFSVLDAGRTWHSVSHLAYAQARLESDFYRAGPAATPDADLNQRAGRPVPLSSAYVARVGKIPREQLADTLHWVVTCLPNPGD